MNASNLAVCLAPSLFHWCTGGPARSASASPRRQTKHQPDPRELGQNKAAHDCLLFLIKNHRELFSVSISCGSLFVCLILNFLQPVT